jgi:hypothetical protein
VRQSGKVDVAARRDRGRCRPALGRTFVNFLVDGIIGAAFLVTAGTGVLFLLPRSWVAGSSGDAATMLGLPLPTLLAIHDWTGVAMMAGVILHGALHWRWIVTMTRRFLGRSPGRAPRAAQRPARQRSAAPQPCPPPSTGAAARSSPGAISPQPSATAPAPASATGPARYTRGGFLKGAALV